MEKYLTIQQLDEKERGKELSSLNYITLISLFACVLIKCFSDFVKHESQDDLQEIEVIRELEEKKTLFLFVELIHRLRFLILILQKTIFLII